MYCFISNIRASQGKKGYVLFHVAKVQDVLFIGNQTRVISIQSKNASRSERTSEDPSKAKIGATA